MVNFVNSGINDPSMAKYDYVPSPLSQLRHREANRGMAKEIHKSQMGLQDLEAQKRRAELETYNQDSPLRQARREQEVKQIGRQEELAAIRHPGEVYLEQWRNDKNGMLETMKRKEGATAEAQAAMAEMENETVALRRSMNATQGFHNAVSVYNQAQTESDKAAAMEQVQFHAERTAQWLEANGMEEDAAELRNDLEGSMKNIVKEWQTQEQELLGFESLLKQSRAASASRAMKQFDHRLEKQFERYKAKVGKEFYVHESVDSFAAMVLQDGPRNADEQAFLGIYFQNMVMDTMGAEMLNLYYVEGREAVIAQMEADGVIKSGQFVSPEMFITYLSKKWGGELMRQYQGVARKPAPTTTTPPPAAGPPAATVPPQGPAAQTPPAAQDGRNTGPTGPNRPVPLPGPTVDESYNTVPKPNEGMRDLGKGLQYDGTRYYINGKQMVRGARYYRGGKWMIWNGADPRNPKAWGNVPAWDEDAAIFPYGH